MTDDGTPLRCAAARLVGPAPVGLDAPCTYCAARPGEPCRWLRAPGPPALHSARLDRWSCWSTAHARFVTAVAAWAESVGAGRASRGPELRARARHRSLCRRAVAAGAAAPSLPEPSAVLAAAGAVAAR